MTTSCGHPHDWSFKTPEKPDDPHIFRLKLMKSISWKQEASNQPEEIEEYIQYLCNGNVRVPPPMPTQLGIVGIVIIYMGVSKNRGKTPKMEGFFYGKPY